MSAPRLRPPFPYFGGKQMISHRIVSMFPEHEHYVEPFCGSLSVLLAKPISTMETVNDIDGDIMTFWQVLRDKPDEFIRACALTPHSRAEYVASFSRLECDDVERARRIWVCLTQGRGATLRRSGWRHYVKPSGATGFPAYLDGYVGRMVPLLDRLHHVTLEAQSALDIIDKYGSYPDVLIYVDPPYLGSSRSTANDHRKNTLRYQNEMLSESDHEVLIDALVGCRASVVISGYASTLYKKRLAYWPVVEITTGTGQSARGEWSARTEVLWTNRSMPDTCLP